MADPSAAIEYVKSQLYPIYKKPYIMLRDVNKLYYRNFESAGSLDVMSEEWDTLILLDACRHDYISDITNLPGKLESRRSPGSMSRQFMERSFAGRKFHDTVYVTANPFAAGLEKETFHDVVSLIDDQNTNDSRAVPPAVVSRKVREIHNKYPQKRVIAHFMQPHEPFLSDFGQKVSRRLCWAGNQYHLPNDISITDLERAYQENLELVLEEVYDLVEEIDGKIVVSADHGELLGERLYPIPIRGFEHPASIYEDELLEVPWLIIDGPRRSVTSDPPNSSGEIASDVAQKRLEDLGYV